MQIANNRYILYMYLHLLKKWKPLQCQWNYEMTSHTTCYNVIYLWAKETNQELEETNKEIKCRTFTKLPDLKNSSHNTTSNN